MCFSYLLLWIFPVVCCILTYDTETAGVTVVGLQFIVTFGAYQRVGVHQFCGTHGAYAEVVCL